jgi:hypothetical protein
VIDGEAHKPQPIQKPDVTISSIDENPLRIQVTVVATALLATRLTVVCVDTKHRSAAQKRRKANYIIYFDQQY